MSTVFIINILVYNSFKRAKTSTDFSYWHLKTKTDRNTVYLHHFINNIKLCKFRLLVLIVLYSKLHTVQTTGTSHYASLPKSKTGGKIHFQKLEL